MASLTDGAGKNVNVTTAQLRADFGTPAVQGLVHDALTPAAQSSLVEQPFGGSDGDGFSVGLSTTSQDGGKWLQKGQYPALASDYGGNTYLIDGVHTDAQGNSFVTVQNPTNPSMGTANISLSTASQDFHYFDRGTHGVGTQFTATSSASGLDAGQKYKYQGMSVGADGQAQVDLTDSHNLPVSLPVSQFGQTFGAQALKNLLDSSRTNPATETTAPSAASYGAVANSELFAVSTSPDDIKQGDYEGDCYLTSSMVAMQRQDPQALQKMIRPSSDGNPNDYDVRFYLPQKDGSFEPVWVTVNNQLATLPDGQLAGDKGVTDPTNGKTQIGYALIEKAYAQFNQQYGTQSENAGYDGIAGGVPSIALQYLTGKPQHDVTSITSTNSNAMWQALSQANTGAPVVAGTKQSNAPSDQIAANVYNSHAYTVLGTYTDTKTDQLMVQLRNPWGVNTDAQGNTVPGGNGEFSVSFADFQKSFDYVSAAGAASSNSGA